MESSITPTLYSDWVSVRKCEPERKVFQLLSQVLFLGLYKIICEVVWKLNLNLYHLFCGDNKNKAVLWPCQTVFKLLPSNIIWPTSFEAHRCLNSIISLLWISIEHCHHTALKTMIINWSKIVVLENRNPCSSHSYKSATCPLQNILKGIF